MVRQKNDSWGKPKRANLYVTGVSGEDQGQEEGVIMSRDHSKSFSEISLKCIDWNTGQEKNGCRSHRSWRKSQLWKADGDSTKASEVSSATWEFSTLYCHSSGKAKDFQFQELRKTTSVSLFEEITGTPDQERIEKAGVKELPWGQSPSGTKKHNFAMGILWTMAIENNNIANMSWEVEGRENRT